MQRAKAWKDRRIEGVNVIQGNVRARVILKKKDQEKKGRADTAWDGIRGSIGDHGFAALVCDHRNLGTSDGEPRGEFIPAEQIRMTSDDIASCTGNRQ
jgi:hypothetical protein